MRLRGVTEDDHAILLSDLDAFAGGAETGSAPDRLDRLPELIWRHLSDYLLEKFNSRLLAAGLLP